MGVCGVGKSTIARQLAEALDGNFVEGDDHHAPESKHDMANGVPLTDAARFAWLERIAVTVNARRDADDRPTVIACSALKKAYRAYLKHRLGPVVFVHLKGAPALIRNRLSSRQEHFMPASMLDSQIHDLEIPNAETEGSAVLHLDVAGSIDEIVEASLQFCLGQGDRSDETGNRERQTPAGPHR